MSHDKGPAQDFFLSLLLCAVSPHHFYAFRITGTQFQAPSKGKGFFLLNKRFIAMEIMRLIVPHAHPQTFPVSHADWRKPICCHA